MTQAPGRPAGRTLVVQDKTPLSADVVGLTLTDGSGGRLPDWTPGAHVDLILPDGTMRQYSLCGSRWDAFRYRVAVLREPDGRGGSAYVHDRLRPGDLVGVGGPRNNFPLVPSQRYLFIAGGIGITPLLPMINQAAMLDADWRLLYAGRSAASMAFLDALAPHGDRVVLARGDQGERLDLASWLGAAQPGVKVYCCGPARLVAQVRALCAVWPPYTLRTEQFTAPDALPAPAWEGPFEVELRRAGRTVPVQPGVTVLEAVQQAGVTVLSSCRRGLCGTCETTVLGGRPDHRDSLLEEEDRARGDCMLICVSRSADARLVLDL